MKKILLSVAISAISMPVLAQDANIEEVLVTATRVEQSLHKTLASVSVISRQDIVNSPVASLPELLGKEAGIDISNSGGRGSATSIFMRGTNSGHVLVLIDGVRVSSATTGATALQHIPLEQIERIEIVRGPRSSLYGAEAIGGVIQIFTRKPQGGSVMAELGSFDSRKSTFAYGGGNQNNQFNLTLGYDESAGFDNTEADGTLNDDDDGYEETSLGFAASHQFSNAWSLAVSGLRTAAEAEFDSGGDDYTDSMNQSLALNLDAPLSKNLQATLSVAQYKDERDSFGTYVNYYNTQRDSVLAQLDYTVLPNNLISVGYDYYDDSADSSDSYIINSRENSAYFTQYQGEMQDFLLSASFRSDDNEAFGRHNTRSFAGGYNFTGSTLVSVSYGTAFKAPTFNDLYYPFTDFGYGFTYQGNPELRPETSESTEIMLRSEWRGIGWSMSYYQTDIKDLIEGSADYSTVENVSDVQIKGAELDVDFSVADWQLNTTLSYTDPRNEATDELIRNRARGKVAVSMQRSFGAYDVALFWQAQSHRIAYGGERLAGYNTVDLRASYAVKQNFKVTAKVNNLFDNDYVINNNSTGHYQTPGLNFSLAALYSFGH